MAPFKYRGLNRAPGRCDGTFIIKTLTAFASHSGQFALSAVLAAEREVRRTNGQPSHNTKSVHLGCNVERFAVATLRNFSTITLGARRWSLSRPFLLASAAVIKVCDVLARDHPLHAHKRVRLTLRAQWICRGHRGEGRNHLLFRHFVGGLQTEHGPKPRLTASFNDVAILLRDR
jgi:hypothetical protein